MKIKQPLIVSSIVFMFVLACQGFAKPVTDYGTNENTPAPSPSLQPTGEQGDVTLQELQPQIIIVMDVSGSMGTYVIPSSPPDELRSLLDRIETIDNNPEIKDLEDQLDSILEQPNIKAVYEKLSESRYKRLKYIQETLGIDLFGLVISLEVRLEDYGCPDYLATYMVEAESVDDSLAYLESDCRALLQDQRTEIVRKIQFLDNEQLLENLTEIRRLDNEYNELIGETDYYKIDDQLGALYDQNGYYNLTSELDDAAESLGLPTRLDFAKSAANSILDLIELDYRVSGQYQKVGLVVFETYAKMLQPLTTDTQVVRTIIDGLNEQQTTNLGGGLEIALQVAGESANPTTIILLSDGWSNTGPSRDFIMGSLSEQANTQQTRICSAGFGTKEEDVDKELLDQLANSAGGKYLFTSSGGELVSFFISCRQSTVAENVIEFQGPINPGQTVDVGRFEIEKNSAELTLSLNYIDGELNLLVTDPSGIQVTTSYPGLTQVFSAGLQLWTIENPETGTWKLQVESADKGERIGVYYVVLSTKLGPELSNNLLPIGLATLAGILGCGVILVLMIGLFFYFRLKKK